MKKAPINELFEKVYLINLDKRSDKLNITKEYFESNNIIYERFAAISPETIKTDPKFSRFMCYPQEKMGAIGCALSHQTILEECLEKGYESVLICEDDVTFCEDFNNIFRNKLSSLPNDWNILHLGYNRDGSYIYKTNMVNFTKINDDWESFDGFSGTTCWGFKREIIPFLLDNFFYHYPVSNPLNTFHIDLLMTQVGIYKNQNVKIYSTIEPIVHNQFILSSDIGYA